MKTLTTLSLAAVTALLIGCGGGNGGGSTPTDGTASSSSLSNNDSDSSTESTSSSGSTVNSTGTGFGSFTATSLNDIKGATIVFKTDPNLNADAVVTSTHIIGCDGKFHTTQVMTAPSINLTMMDITGMTDVQAPENNMGAISMYSDDPDAVVLQGNIILTDETGKFYEGQCYLGTYDSSQCLHGQIAYSVTQQSCN